MPDVSTEVAIATTTLGSAASTITFSSISSAYTDLRLVLVNKMSGNGGNGIRVRYNSDSATNYSYTEIAGYGSVISTRGTNETAALVNLLGAGSTTIPININMDIFSYAGSTYKTMLASTAGDLDGSGSVELGVTLWRSTSAITSIVLSSVDAFNFAIGTTATLYGIL
jgi:hypothetical protein